MIKFLAPAIKPKPGNPAEARKCPTTSLVLIATVNLLGLSPLLTTNLLSFSSSRSLKSSGVGYCSEEYQTKKISLCTTCTFCFINNLYQGWDAILRVHSLYLLCTSSSIGFNLRLVKRWSIKTPEKNPRRAMRGEGEK